ERAAGQPSSQTGRDSVQRDRSPCMSRSGVPLLEVDLLGPFEARLNGLVLQLRRSDVRRLLALLALRYGRPRERLELAQLLWPDPYLAEEKALASLRAALSHLRRALGEHAQHFIQEPSGATLRLGNAAVD